MQSAEAAQLGWRCCDNVQVVAVHRLMTAHAGPKTYDAKSGSVPRAPTLRGYGRLQAKRFLAGAGALLATNALGLLIPWLLKQSIDVLRHNEASAMAQVGQYALAILGLAAAQAVIRTVSRVLVFNAGREVEFVLRGDLFRHVMSLPLSFHRTHPTGELMSRLTNDLSAVRMLFGPGVLNVMNTTIVYATGLWLMASLSPRLTLFALLPLPLVVASAEFASRRIHQQSRALQAQMGELANHLQEDLAGVATLRGYTLEADRHRRFAAASNGYLRRSLDLVRTRGFLGPQFAIAGGLGTLIVVWLGGREVIAGRMTVGGLVAFNAYFAYLAWPTMALGWVLSLWQRGLAGWGRVRDVFATPPAETRSEGDIPEVIADLRQARLEVRRLSVEIDGRRVLHDVSFTLEPGTTTAIVGRTGCGKSTLVDALLRLAEVPPGSLFLGKVDATTLPLAVLRRQIAYAPQDSFLFSASIADNIAFGDRSEEGRPRLFDAHGDEARRAIRQAAEDAGLMRDLKELPDGIDTLVGERGITLSGGQRQRVALARALYARSPLLILDDSLSSVDAQTEQTILRQLQRHLGARTAVIISHRVAAVETAGQILVLDEGRLVERGRHDELIAAGGVYAALYREQAEPPGLDVAI